MMCPACRNDHLERPQSLIIWNDASVGRISLYFCKIVQRPKVFFFFKLLFLRKALPCQNVLHGWAVSALPGAC